MTEAALDRLNDLAATVEGLRQLLGRADLPALLVARALVDVDKCAARLDRHAAVLAQAASRGK